AQPTHAEPLQGTIDPRTLEANTLSLSETGGSDLPGSARQTAFSQSRPEFTFNFTRDEDAVLQVAGAPRPSASPDSTSDSWGGVAPLSTGMLHAAPVVPVTERQVAATMLEADALRDALAPSESTCWPVEQTQLAAVKTLSASKLQKEPLQDKKNRADRIEEAESEDEEGDKDEEEEEEEDDDDEEEEEEEEEEDEDEEEDEEEEEENEDEDTEEEEEADGEENQDEDAGALRPELALKPALKPEVSHPE
ncbi:unnamed protein product, partial [Polarella glacialis]